MHTSTVVPRETWCTFIHLFAIHRLGFPRGTLDAIRGLCCHRCTSNHQNGITRGVCNSQPIVVAVVVR